jgi:D-lactate dehydrogenase
VGVIGAGKIGKAFAKIIKGFGCKVIITDPSPDSKFLSESQSRYDKPESITSEINVTIYCLILSIE